MELEPTDFSLKRMLQANPNVYMKPQDTFVYLRTQQERFWTEMSAAVSLLYEWAQYLRVPDSINDLKAQIWENFLCRLSLDARLILGKTMAESNGNEVLRIMVETVETTLLSRLSVHHLPTLGQEHHHPQQQQPPALPQQQPQVQQQQPFVPSPEVPPLPSSLQAFYAQQQQQQQQQMAAVDSKEMAALQRSLQHMALPPAPGQGMPIKLRRTKEDIEYYKPRRRKSTKNNREQPSNKGSRSRKQMTLSRSSRRDEDDEEEEDDEDDEEDDDKPRRKKKDSDSEEDDDEEDDPLASRPRRPL